MVGYDVEAYGTGLITYKECMKRLGVGICSSGERGFGVVVIVVWRIKDPRDDLISIGRDDLAGSKEGL